jgi:tungstate transport system permease protein
VALTSISWSELGTIIALSLLVSGTAVLLASATGVPLGAFLGLSRFRGRATIVRVIYTLMGLPPTVAGLAVYMILRGGGPLGEYGLLFTPAAMVIAQWVLVTPIVIGLVTGAVESRDRRFRETSVSLGATDWQTRFLVLREARPAVFAAIAAGLGRAMAEVGAVVLVGGNIRWKTRVMTTAILLETRRGNFDQALILGGVLLAIGFLINSFVHRLQTGKG